MKDLNITSVKQKGLYGKGDVDDYKYIENIWTKIGFVKTADTLPNQRSKHLNSKYIYLVSYKIAKIQNKGLRS